MLSALVILIFVGLIWTTTGIVMGGVARRGVSVEAMQCLSYLLGTLTCLALLPLYPALEVSGKFAWFAMGMYFVVGALNYFLNTTMTAAMNRGPNSLVWAILQAGMVMPFLVGICFHDVHAGALRLLGMAAMIAALVLLSMDKEDGGGSKGKSWLFLAFVAFVIAGVQQTVATEPSYYPETRSGIPAIYRCLALCGGNAAIAIPYLVGLACRGGFKGLCSIFSAKWLWIYAIVLQASILIEKLFLSFKAMDMLAKLGSGAISYPVMVVSCIAGFTLYSIVFLHEKITWRSAGGLFLCALGIVMLSL